MIVCIVMFADLCLHVIIVLIVLCVLIAMVYKVLWTFYSPGGQGQERQAAPPEGEI